LQEAKSRITGLAQYATNRSSFMAVIHVTLFSGNIMKINTTASTFELLRD
jgi:hypothetical protein